MSLDSSQRFWRGKRKPEGGGPAGVAAHREEVEKRAVAKDEGVAVRLQRRAVDEAEVGRALERMASDLGIAIVILKVEWQD